MKKKDATNKTDTYNVNDIWSLDILVLKEYCPGNKRGYRYILINIDNFSKFGWTVPVKNKSAQTLKDSFEKILISSERKPSLLETDRGEEFCNNIFQNFSNNNNIEHYSRNTDLGAVFAERTIRDLLKRPVSEKSDGYWVDVLPIIKKTLY